MAHYIYIEGSHVSIKKKTKNAFHSLKIEFVEANSVDPNATFHLGPRSLPKYPSRGFLSTKG